MNKKHMLMLKGIFYAMIAIFVLIMTFLFLINSENISTVFFPVTGVLAFLFFIYGALMIFFSIKYKPEKKLKIFLILTGASALGLPVSVVLHNFFYALSVVFSAIPLLKFIMEVLHVSFFLIAIPVCPVVFLIGAIASIILFKRKNRK